MPARQGALWLAPLMLIVALLGGELALDQAIHAAGDCTVASTDAAVDDEEQAMLRLINNHRAQHGLTALSFSPTLTRAAAWLSKDMADKNYTSHTDSIGRDPKTRLADCGYNYNTSWGENWAAGYATASATFERWKNSSTHNEQMLGSSFRVAGIARHYNSASTYKWYWTLDLGGYNDGNTHPSVTASPTPTPTAATPTPRPTAILTPTLTLPWWCVYMQC